MIKMLIFSLLFIIIGLYHIEGSIHKKSKIKELNQKQSIYDITDYIHICSAKDPEINKCINKSISDLRSRLKDGISELDVPAIEPLKLDVIKLRRGLQSNITDLLVYGPSAFEIKELRANIPKNKFAFKVNLPYLYFTGNYELDMQLLFIRLKGNGPIYGNLTNYYFEAIMKGNKIVKDGVEYLKFERMKIRITLGKAKLRLENLFSENESLRVISHQLVNENSEVFLNEIKPTLEISLAEKFTEIANKITLRFAYDELFKS